MIRAKAARRANRSFAALLVTTVVLVGLTGLGGTSDAAPNDVPPQRVSSPLPVAGCKANRPRRQSTVQFTLHARTPDGDRAALVRVPARAAHRPATLVVALHGAGGDGTFMERYSGLGHAADRDGFVAVFPSAATPTHVWNLDVSSAPDDVGFVAALINQVATVACIDPARVFAVGVSNGGALTARLACELSDRIAGVVIVAGGFSRLPICTPARPVSVLEIHGSADPVVPYTGDPRNGRIGAVLPWVDAWAARDRCATVNTPQTVAPRTLRMDWSGCADGTRVAHIKVLGGRHQWPGATPPDPGPASTLSAARQTWSFLSRLPPRPTS